MEWPLTRQLAITGRMVRERFDTRLREEGASLATFTVLRAAADEPQLSQRELAERVDIEGSTLVRHLDRMEREGLVVRCRDDRDRRVVRVGLTPAGWRRHEELVEVSKRLNAQLLALLTTEEAETLALALPKVRDGWHPEADEGARRSDD
jgi:MarR family transcriptional regulator, transcriptional regulator for hemolysin